MEKTRKCIGCGEVKNSRDLIKITKNYKTDELVINPNNYTFGRSVYICKNSQCIELALKKNKISKFLKKYIDECEKENIKTVLNSLVVVKH